MNIDKHFNGNEFSPFRPEEEFYGGQKKQENDLGLVIGGAMRLTLSLLVLLSRSTGGGKSLWDAAKEMVSSRRQGTSR